MGASSVAEVVALFEQFGQDHYDEEISQLDHALQTAALAAADRAGDELVAAALLHDVGHLLELQEGGSFQGAQEVDHGHEARGARWLAPLFPPAVTNPIALHVAAKRYRCTIDPHYRAGLSAGSEASLVRQGGVMSPDEVTAFELRPTHTEAVWLRTWDDGGKVEGLDIPALDTYLPLLERLATR